MGTSDTEHAIRFTANREALIFSAGVHPLSDVVSFFEQCEEVLFGEHLNRRALFPKF